MSQELTPQQAQSFRKLFSRRRAIMLLLPVVLLAVCLYAQTAYKNAEKEYVRLCQLSDENLAKGEIDDDVIYERAYALQVLEQKERTRPLLMGVAAFCALAGEVLTFVYYRTTYPYLKKKNMPK